MTDRSLVGSTPTFDLDLVFNGGSAVGDVKYKLSREDRVRSDPYQIVASAKSFHA